MARSSSRSRAISLATFCELCGRNSSGSTRDASTDLEVGEDDLERPLEDLGLAPDVQVIARLERARQVLGRVPEPGPDAAGLVAQLQVQVEVPLAIGPELLVGDQEDLVDRVPVSQLVDVAAAHASFQSFQSFRSSPGVVPGRKRGRDPCPSSGRL